LPAVNTHNRTFTPFDIYPTIMESMGAQIKGNRLGLGTSLFADKPTLTEGSISVEEMNTEISKSSKIYDWLLYGRQITE
jgi:phosphoglycerol transferase